LDDRAIAEHVEERLAQAFAAVDDELRATRAWSTRRPRSMSLLSNAVATTWFSVEPAQMPSGTFVPRGREELVYPLELARPPDEPCEPNPSARSAGRKCSLDRRRGGRAARYRQ
jgi:hypothetical protein